MGSKNLTDREKIRQLEEEIRQKTLLLNYYRRKIKLSDLILGTKQTTMAIQIQKITENRYLVNNKEIYKDMEGDWVSSSSSNLTEKEIDAFTQYIISVERI